MKHEPRHSPVAPIAGAAAAQGRVLRDVEAQPRPMGLGRRGVPVRTDMDRVPHLHPTADSAARDNSVREEKAFLDGFRQGHLEGSQEARSAIEIEAGQAGFRAGHEQGVQEGLAAGRLQAEQELDARTRAVQATADLRLEQFDELLGGIAKQFDITLSRRLDAAEDDMVALTYAAICRLLGAHALDANVVMLTVREAIEQWLKAGNERLGSHPLTVHMNPQDLRMLQDDPQVSSWLNKQTERGLSWQSDDTVELGGCLIKGHQGSLDARLETQLHELTAVLLQGRHAFETKRSTGAPVARDES